MTAPDAAELDLAFTWTLSDYVRARRATMLSRNLVLELLVAAPLLALMLAGVGGLLGKRAADVGIDLTILKDIGLVLVALIVVAEWILLSAWPSIEGLKQRRRDRNLQYPIHHLFAPLGITIKGKTSQLALGWKSIDHIRETSRYFLFFYTPSEAYFLPKRDLAAADLDALRRLILSHRADASDLEGHRL